MLVFGKAYEAISILRSANTSTQKLARQFGRLMAVPGRFQPRALHNEVSALGVKQTSVWVFVSI